MANKLYTRTGDNGETSLIGGTRISKGSIRIDICGEVDELNSFVGLARTRAALQDRSPINEYLVQIQNELFELGSILASPPVTEETGHLEISQGQIDRIEEWIDSLTSGLPELQSFVLPGGSELNAALHICRTVCRRVERKVLSLSRADRLTHGVLPYLNRLSDLFFAMARYESHICGIQEYLWEPGNLSTHIKENT